MANINDEELDDGPDHNAGLEVNDDVEEVFIADEDDEDAARAAAGKGKKEAATDDDERLGADPDSETDEQKRERRRKERKAKKERKREYDTRDRQELNFLRSRNEDLERRLGAVERSQKQQGSRVTVAQIDGRIGQIQSKIDEADTLIAAAITAQNGEDVNLIMKERDKLRDGLLDLRATRRELVATSKGDEGTDDDSGRNDDRPTTSRQQREEVHQVVRKNTQVFAGRHSWFDGKSSDSLVVMGIDQQLRNEGMHPANGAFWQALEQRMQQALPHRFEDSGADDDSDDEDDEDESPARRVNGSDTNKTGKDLKNGNGTKGPKMAAPSGSGRGPGKTYRISKERIDAMKEAGIWDDPKARARMVKRYAAFDREHGVTG